MAAWPPPKKRFFEALGAVTKLSTFAVGLIPLEDANELVKKTVMESGVPL